MPAFRGLLLRDFVTILPEFLGEGIAWGLDPGGRGLIRSGISPHFCSDLAGGAGDPSGQWQAQKCGKNVGTVKDGNRQTGHHDVPEGQSVCALTAGHCVYLSKWQHHCNCAADLISPGTYSVQGSA
eukprot:1160517-Pelagomonas_calceolata.AAC.10